MANLATYYKIPGFLKWLETKNFSLYNDTNISLYFTVFQKESLCDMHKCEDCNGEKVVYDSEQDVCEGKVKSKPCPNKTESLKIVNAKTLFNRFKIDKAYEKITLETIPVDKMF